MTRTHLIKIGLIPLLISTACATIFAQPPAQPNDSPTAGQPVQESDPAAASYVIFSNLSSDPLNRFDTNSLVYTIAGNRATETETSYAIRFIPKVDVQAKLLSAAIGYTSGTKLVSLGIYSDNSTLDTVGDPLPGGQASTTSIPDLDQCCQLTKVTLSGTGVTLSAGTKYWLVASADNLNGATFLGGWHHSYGAVFASYAPPSPWSDFSGDWGAAEIRGTKVQTFPSRIVPKANPLKEQPKSPQSNLVIFTNLSTLPGERYLYGPGLLITGNNVSSQPEVWEALPFTPNKDVHVTSVSAAIAYLSGTKLVNIGIYSDEGGTVGTLLPDAQASSTDIPTDGDCCGLTKVTFSGAGVALAANTQYWLVASPDDVNGADFYGVWQQSSLAVAAYEQPEKFINWTSFSGLWLAAEIRGTTP